MKAPIFVKGSLSHQFFNPQCIYMSCLPGLSWPDPDSNKVTQNLCK